MAIPTSRQPVILLGMHRSGTAMIARLLDELGLFQGSELQDDHESTWFLEVNDMLLRRVGASWDNPGPMHGFLQNELALRLTSRCLHDDLSSKRMSPFLGMKRYLRHRGLENFDQPWGWKDPRTIFTLPLWLRLFPEARMVYIVRNGVDVAKSLVVREARELARRIAEYDDRAGKITSHSMLQRAGFKGSARCLTLAGAFSLWEEYVAEAEQMLDHCTQERLVVPSEQFLESPGSSSFGLAALASFCGLKAGDAAIERAARQINPGRANAFAADAELLAFYHEVKSTRWMSHYGYSNLLPT
jgi:hypothetical protein